LNRSRRLPFGPNQKDQLWRAGAWIAGVVALLIVIWIFSGLQLHILSWWQWALGFAAGMAFSTPWAQAWRHGHAVDHRKLQRPPTVEVLGKEGSTYVLLPGQTGRRARPKELGPGHWGLYSVFVRAPVFLGDVVLTLAWRLLSRARGVTSGTGWSSPPRDPNEEF
jgi:hypothetical protein